MRTLLFVSLAAFCSFAQCISRGTSVALGTVFKNEEVSLDLVLANEGKDILQVGQATTSCDCLKILATPSTMAPGEKSKIACVYRSAMLGRVKVDVQVGEADPTKVIRNYSILGFVADRAWLLSSSELVSNHAAHYVLVDTRAPELFAELRIPKSLNIPAFAIRTRADLKERNLVLVGQGADSVVLLEQVATLRNQGFKNVFMLNGGLSGWLREGRAKEGTTLSPLSFASVSASDFARMRLETVWTSIEVSARGAAASSMFDFRANNLEELESILERSAGQGGTVANSNFLIIAPDESLYAKIEGNISKKHPQAIFYLRGGSAALSRYYEQAALAGSGGQIYQLKPVEGRAVIAGGCHTCGR